MITYSVNGNIIKHNNLSAKSNRIIERMTQEETELNMAGSLNVSGTVKASKFMTADGTIIDITNTNNKIQELQESIVTPQEHRDLRDEMLKADQEFVNKSEMDELNNELLSLRTADQGFATKDLLEEEITHLKNKVNQNAISSIQNSNNDLHNKNRAGNVSDTIPSDYNPTMELKQFHSTNKDSTIGYGGSSIQFSTNNGDNGGGAQWPTGSIVSNIDPNNSSGYQGGLLFYTAAGGLKKPQKLAMSMGGPDQRAYFAGNVGIGTKDPQEKLDVNGTIRVHGSDGKFNATGDGSNQTIKKEYIQFASTDKPGSSDGVRLYAEGPSNQGKLVMGIQDDLQREESFIIRGESHQGENAAPSKDIAEFTADGNFFTNNVTFKKNGTNWWHRTGGDAAIVNADSHNTLMMVGREHEGTRKIGMWDTVDVNGTLNVNGNLKVNDKVINLEEDDDAKIVPKSYWMSYYNSNSSGTASSFIKDELKTNSNINYNWGSGYVGSSGRNDNVFIKFSGHITSNVSGGTLFRVKTDDGARLFFNNRQIIYSWKLQGPTYHQSENENLKANVRYPFVLEWYEHGGGAVIILEWKKPGGNWQVIPADAFSTNLKLGGTLSLASGISHYGGDYGQAEYYKIGNIVYVDGLIKGTNGKSHLATLPLGYKPDKRLIFNLNNHSGMYRLDVTADGIIYWIAGSRTHNWLSLSGISFYVKG